MKKTDVIDEILQEEERAHAFLEALAYSLRQGVILRIAVQELGTEEYLPMEGDLFEEEMAPTQLLDLIILIAQQLKENPIKGEREYEQGRYEYPTD